MLVRHIIQESVSMTESKGVHNVAEADWRPLVDNLISATCGGLI
jgi:hypothetical protein